MNTGHMVMVMAMENFEKMPLLKLHRRALKTKMTWIFWITLPPTIGSGKRGCLQYSYLSNRAIFHWTMIMGEIVLLGWIISTQLFRVVFMNSHEIRIPFLPTGMKYVMECNYQVCIPGLLQLDSAIYRWKGATCFQGGRAGRCARTWQIKAVHGTSRWFRKYLYASEV